MHRIITLLLIISAGCAASTEKSEKLKKNDDIIFQLGKRACQIYKHGKSNTLASFVALHDNEKTNIEAFLSIKDIPDDIILFEVRQTGEKLIKYEMDNKDYLFDPNRIFTETGIAKTLANYNTVFPRQLNEKVRSFADSLLSIIIPQINGKYIVAIHNNTDGNFSALTYKNSKDANDVFISQNEDTDDFFIVTNRADFDYLKSLNQNVVLQSENAEDDGSLSIYCQKKGIPYINIEAQHGHKDKQVKMIEMALSLIKNRNH
jgi:hypothetical protein